MLYAIAVAAVVADVVCAYKRAAGGADAAWKNEFS
jgi:hypothetical protein